MITDMLDRELRPGNVVVVNTVQHCGMVYDGIYTVLGTHPLGSGYTVDLKAYTGLCRLSSVVCEMYGDKCYYHGCLVLKLAENTADLI